MRKLIFVSLVILASCSNSSSQEPPQASIVYTTEHCRYGTIYRGLLQLCTSVIAIKDISAV